MNGSAETERHIATINGTNAYLVVAENYLRNGRMQNIVQAQLPGPISSSQCEVIKQEATRFFDRSKSYQMTTNICEVCIFEATETLREHLASNVIRFGKFFIYIGQM